MTAPQFKLNYKIVGRRSLNVVDGDGHYISMDMVDIEWTHADGPIKDTHLIPINHPPIFPDSPALQYKKMVSGTRDVVKDQINVKHGTPDSIVMQICEEKRHRLALNLEVEP